MSLSIAINLGIIFYISYKPSLNTNDTVKIGIVSLEGDQQTRNLKGLKNVDSDEVNKEAKEVTEKSKEKPEEEIKKNKKEEIVEKTEENGEVKEVKAEEKKEKPSLADLKKAISSSKPKLDNTEVKKESFNPEKDSNEDLDRILGTVQNGEGLVSGNKIGTIGGKILVKWNSNNRKPQFPETAEYSGKNGVVKIILKVDSYGNIVSYGIEKGSGVPEIDAAIERVVGTWKINLLKSGKAIGGTFYINYSFNLK